MTDQYMLIPNIDDLIEDFQADSITSRTFHKGNGFTAVLFAFDAGQELSEHTSTKSAILQIIEGEASLTLGEDAHKVSKGAWIQMQPNLKHSIYAETPLKMILLMLDKA